MILSTAHYVFKAAISINFALKNMFVFRVRPYTIYYSILYIYTVYIICGEENVKKINKKLSRVKKNTVTKHRQTDSSQQKKPVLINEVTTSRSKNNYVKV